MFGVYIHIPFCVRKCLYCDFVSVTDQSRIEAYLDALCAEIRMWSGKCPQAESVFIGGGTPSLLKSAQMQRIFIELRQAIRIAADAEITVECNPGTLDAEKLQAYRSCGVNRLSIGLQSTHDELLKRIGRIHDFKQFSAGFEMARAAGFENINVDVMHGLPGQNCEMYLETLRSVIAYKPAHISSYALILEEGTPLYAAVQEGSEKLPDEDTVYDMQDAGMALLLDAGYRRYEVSNFALPGFACRHNLNYWENGPYLGLGLNAHSAMRMPRRGWTRWSNQTVLDEYIRLCMQGESPTAECRTIDTQEEMFETVMMGLRKVEGISLAYFQMRFGRAFTEAYAQPVRELLARGWLEFTDGYVRLTDKGMDVQNMALVHFL